MAPWQCFKEKGTHRVRTCRGKQSGYDQDPVGCIVVPAVKCFSGLSGKVQFAAGGKANE